MPVAEVHAARRRVRLRDEAMLMYTSGTTTNPKGCVLTHEALVRTGVAAAERWELVHDERFWNPLPMFHMGQVFPLLAHMHVGATLVTSSHFDAAEALQLIEAERITFAYPTFPAITQDLIRHPDFETHGPRHDPPRQRHRAARDAARGAGALRPGAGRDPVRHDRDLRRHLVERARRPVREADDHGRACRCAASTSASSDPETGRGAGRPGSAARSRSARPGCSSATTTTPRRRRRRCAAAGSTPATSAGSTRTGG